MNQTAELTGRLEFMGLADLLQLLGGNGNTGILRLHSQYTPDIGVVYFTDGNPVDAIVGNMTADSALYALFGWTTGQFEFRKEQFSREKAIKQGRMEIILEGLRMMDDGQIPTLGPSGPKESGALSSGKEGSHVIKGPLVDYMYVVDEETFGPDEPLVVEGKHGDWIWVILEGAVDVIRDVDGKEPLKILKLGDGAFIGSVESFLMKGTVRSATVRSATTVQLGVLDAQRLAIEFSKLSASMRDLVISLDRRLKRVTDNVADIRMKKNNIRDYLNGRKPVVKQGQPEEKLFMISQGDACLVRRTKQDDVPLAMLGKGDVFGNFHFLNLGHEPDNACVYGSEDLKVSRLDTDQLQAEYQRQSQTFKNIIESTSICISATTQIACGLYQKAFKKP
ncbi:MAG: cyclic nucleotide-binding domain-containing protein [Pseudomonadota bacterium]